MAAQRGDHDAAQRLGLALRRRLPPLRALELRLQIGARRGGRRRRRRVLWRGRLQRGGRRRRRRRLGRREPAAAAAEEVAHAGRRAEQVAHALHIRRRRRQRLREVEGRDVVAARLLALLLARKEDLRLDAPRLLLQVLRTLGGCRLRRRRGLRDGRRCLRSRGLCLRRRVCGSGLRLRRRVCRRRLRRGGGVFEPVHGCARLCARCAQFCRARSTAGVWRWTTRDRACDLRHSSSPTARRALTGRQLVHNPRLPRRPSKPARPICRS